ncbi:hypothetical protein NG799_13835 [Laspinema sp. D1]|uniref:Uncharacterized protein n=1 Tax=Laspinema palackyanum D2a TaxID=2953684 RepID=A0ABT2MV94_9CYAN|nr:hypothetical protein [Laspinema sp. D2a]
MGIAWLERARVTLCLFAIASLHYGSSKPIRISIIARAKLSAIAKFC